MTRIICVVLILFIGSEAALFRNGFKRHKRDSPACPEDCASSPMDIAFVVDASSSIMSRNFMRCKTFIEDFVDQFEISPSAVRVSLVTFGWDANPAFNFADHTSKQDLLAAISGVPYKSDSYTNTSAGINFMMDHYAPELRDEARHVAIVITDGQSQEGRKTALAAERAHNASLEVFAIGVGGQFSADELHTIASDDRHVFTVSSYEALDDIIKRLAYESCDVPTYPECEMDPVDLAFVIDSSVSIGEDNFTAGMDFVKKFVGMFQVDHDHVRVAAVTFGYDVNIEDSFDFKSFEDKKDVMDRLSQIPWRHGNRTNTGAGIRHMREVLMATARNYTAHVCVVLTDGNSQEPDNTHQEAVLAQEDGIEMFAVGVGSGVSRQELENIASSSDNVVNASSYAQLNLIKEELVEVTCNGILRKVGEVGSKARGRFKIKFPAE